ncbi:MAG: type II toxin-antitoxin system VapC family toxin [Bdellovibrionales bacterium]|nr:type II toxin-antitoxin system VapC family toxin [Ramlibacter sp.]
MIILDTNVVSEPMKPNGNPAVLEWLDQQVADTLYVTSTSLAELLLGIELLPNGQRKKALASGLSELMTSLFGPRVLPFDEPAALHFAPLVSRARAAGRIVSVADGQIAAIAAAHKFVVATRDTGPFIAAGLAVINPWDLGH